MQKYGKLGTIFAIITACGGLLFASVSYFSSSEYLVSTYTRELDSLSGAIKNIRIERENERKIWEEQDSALSGRINDHKARVELLLLCISAESIRCIEEKKQSYSMVSSAHASAEKDDTQEKEEIPQKDIIISTKNEVGKIIELFANNPENPKKECNGFLNDPKRFVLHYTATSYDLSAERILQSHLNKFDLDHYAGYHYIIDESGRIYSTRPDICKALAEPKANSDSIHIAYIGDDKPKKEQKEAMIFLIKYLSPKKGIDIKNVTAHADIASKNHKESMEYMFGGYNAFQKDIRLTQTITRDGKQMDALTYAWRAWGDMDFILTINAESQWRDNARGDIDNPRNGDYSFGYCQYNTRWQPLWLEEYRAFKSYQEKLNHCHEKYTYASKLKGGVGSRFHGFKVRERSRARFEVK